MKKIWRIGAATLLTGIMVGGAITGRAQEAEPTPEELPLWEYGIVGLASRLPHYPGSDEYENYLFPLPYFIYRGERVKADEDGVRTIFWQHGAWQTDISMAGNPPVSGDSKAREGMPERNAIGEIGPAIRYYFHDRGEDDAFYLEASGRAAFSIGFADGGQLAYEGYTTELALVYLDSQLFREQRLRFAASASLLYGDEEFHEYFYEVDPAYATSSRQPYRAEAGYSGFQASTAVIKEITPSFWVSLYASWLNNSGAAYADSSLVGTDNNYILGLLLIAKIDESTKKASPAVSQK